MTGFLRIDGHNRIRTLLSSYIDDQVSADEAARVEAHLAGCDECREELESLRMTVQLLSELPVLELPRSFALETAPEPEPSFAGRLWTARLATSAAAALLVALIAGDATGILVSTSTATEAIEVEAVIESETVMAAPASAAAPAPQPATAMRAAPRAPASAVTEEAAEETVASADGHRNLCRPPQRHRRQRPSPLPWLRQCPPRPRRSLRRPRKHPRTRCLNQRWPQRLHWRRRPRKWLRRKPRRSPGTKPAPLQRPRQSPYWRTRLLPTPRPRRKHRSLRSWQLLQRRPSRKVRQR